MQGLEHRTLTYKPKPLGCCSRASCMSSLPTPMNFVSDRDWKGGMKNSQTWPSLYPQWLGRSPGKWEMCLNSFRKRGACNSDIPLLGELLLPSATRQRVATTGIPSSACVLYWTACMLPATKGAYHHLFLPKDKNIGGVQEASSTDLDHNRD